MKTIFLRPNFEFIFSLGLIAILGLPPVLLAQAHKDLDIKIENGDTTINGKNIKTLSAAEKQSALGDINHISSIPTRDTTAAMGRGFRSGNAGHRPVTTQSIVIKDSLGSVVAMKTKKTGPDFRTPRMDNGGNARMRRMNGPGMRYEGKNTQSFDYVNVDNEGITTHVSFHLSEVTNDDLKKMPYVEGPKFEIKDLNIVPEFTTGQTLLMFNLLSKTAAYVKLSDSEGKLIWSEKAVNGSFKKTFALGLNGIYYLQIKQGASIALKRDHEDGLILAGRLQLAVCRLPVPHYLKEAASWFDAPLLFYEGGGEFIPYIK